MPAQPVQVVRVGPRVDRPAFAHPRVFVKGVQRAPMPRGYLLALCLVLAGYALFGKGFAYVGYPPAFVGELVLLAGVGALAVRGGWFALFNLTPMRILLLLIAWGVYRTLPYLRTYGIDALRDAVLYGYAAFAFVVAGFILSAPMNLRRLLEGYRRFVPLLLVAVPALWIVCRFAEGALPMWPWADVPVIYLKGGDPLVHLAGLLGFWVAGFVGEVPRWRVWLMAGSVAVMGTYNRGGLLSFLAAFGVCILLRPHDCHGRKLIGAGLMGLLLLAITNVEFSIPGKDREVSFMQLVSNIASVTGPADDGNLDGTKQWRLQWWGDIVSYTVAGPYFWTGKGFGVNLAEDDGYQVNADNSLRSPHNGHLNILARAGVPGMTLWLLAQIVFAVSIARAYFFADRSRQRNWAGLFLFLFVYWTAFVANACFDVFLEGPMGGVWFWSLYGFGVAAVWCHRKWPQVLDGFGPFPLIQTAPTE